MPNHLLTQFDLHQRLYINVLSGLTDAETNQRPYGDENVNHVKYLAGHLLNSQYRLAIITGIQPTVQWDDLFAVMDQSEARDDFNYPSIKEIKDEWNALYEPTRKGLSNLTPEDLTDSLPPPFEEVADTVGEFWAFTNHHIAYHIGQIGILRKVFGKEAMSYK